MNSTSTSNTILKIENFDLNYKYSKFRNEGIRDMFISFFKHPLRVILNRNKKISILRNVNIEIKKGERVALIGTNGAGKTSICRAITGMHGFQKNIKLNGRVRAIFETSVVVQPELTGRENIHILVDLMFPFLPKDERKKICEDAVNFSEIGHFIDSPFKHYSKGMKSRLFLSVVSSRSTDLLILDEVFNGADQFFNEKISKRVKKMIEDSGAVIFISHSEELLKDICDRGILFHQGQIVFDGDINDALEKYVSLNEES